MDGHADRFMRPATDFIDGPVNRLSQEDGSR